MNKIEKQQENIKNLLKLIQENPELRIVPLVDTECVPNDDFGSWVAGWGSAEVDEIWISDERIYLKSEDYDELIEEAMEEIVCDDESQLEILAENKVDNLEWEKVIIVRINPY